MALKQRHSANRATVFAVVASLHAALLLALVRLGTADARPVEQGPVVQASLIATAPPQPEFTPPIEPVLIEKAILVPTPEVIVTLPVESAVTVAAIEKPSPPPAAEQPGDAPRTVTPADYLRPLKVSYPRAARQTRQQGVVILLVSIDPEGHPYRVNVERSSGHVLLDRAAVEAARAALFRPLVNGGVAQNVQVLIPIEFSLSERLAGI